MSKNNIITILNDIRSLMASRKPILSMDEAATYTGLSKAYLYKLTSSSLIPHSKPLGKLIYFQRSLLDIWMLKNPIKTQAEIEAEAVKYII
jgi:excisionase family DNA binding protein